jgi:hypothetical protein
LSPPGAQGDVIYRVQAFVISSESATISWHERSAVYSSRDKQKLICDVEIKSFLQYFRMQREINLTYHELMKERTLPRTCTHVHDKSALEPDVT